MAVLCAKCGEELLGAINRCWRCGTEYESRSGETDVPPLRRAPVPPHAVLESATEETETAPSDAPLEAILIDPTATQDGATDGGETAAPNSSQAGDPTDRQGNGIVGSELKRQAELQNPPMRRGSPFRPEPTEQQGDVAGEPIAGNPPRAARYPKITGATAGPTLAITLGLLSLGLAYPIPIAGLITSAAGLGLGIWGLSSKRRIAAIVGLLICCAAVACSGFFVAAEVYRLIHGEVPWATPIYPAP